MNTKTKTVIAILTVFILTGITMGYYLRQKNKAIKNESQVQVVQQNPTAQQIEQTPEQPEVIKTETKTIEQPEVIKTETVAAVSTGSITSIDEKTIVVKTNNGDFSLNISVNVSLYSMVKNTPIQKSISDLKVGSKITFEYDTKTNNALAIKLMQ